jgi:hypothetical protein
MLLLHSPAAAAAAAIVYVGWMEGAGNLEAKSASVVETDFQLSPDDARGDLLSSPSCSEITVTTLALDTQKWFCISLCHRRIYVHMYTVTNIVEMQFNSLSYQM